MRRTPKQEDALEPEAETSEPLWQSLRSGLGNKRLLAWLFAASLCGLMDETLVSFGALLVRQRIAADPWMSIAITMVSLSVGELIGLAACDRLLARFSPLRVLAAACVGCAISYAGWLFASSLITCALSLFCVGVFVAPLYPITKAQAYREVPSRGGLVNAIGQVFTSFDVAVPLVLGLLADRYGLLTALAVLIAQPIGVAAIAAFARRRASSC